MTTTSEGAAGGTGRPAGGLSLAVAVARRVHLDGASKVQVAAELGITRFKVARLLAMAHEAGLVRTVVAAPAETDEALEQGLRERYGLRHVVVTTDAGDDPAMARLRVGRLAAEWAEHVVADGDVVGLAWGRTMSVVHEHWHRRVAATFVQLAGSLVRPDVDRNGPELVGSFARRSGGRAALFYAPLLVADATTATALRADPAVADALRQAGSLTKALVAVGAWSEGRSTVFDALPLDERNALRRAGVCAEVTGVLLDAEGRVVEDLADRTLAVSADQLRRADHVVALAVGVDRAVAVRAALRSGLVDGLVTHAALAAAVLAGDRA